MKKKQKEYENLFASTLLHYISLYISIIKYIEGFV